MSPRELLYPPSGDPTVVGYLAMSGLKRDVARWHREEFSSAADRYNGHAFVQGPPDSAVYGHSDGMFIQLAAAFDAFACAVAHRSQVLRDPDRADFGRDNAALAAGVGGKVGKQMAAIFAEEGFRRLTFYRNMAAHRTVIPGRVKMAADEETDFDVITFTLGVGLPPGAPDPQDAPLVPILDGCLSWANDALAKLYAVALDEWGLAADWRLQNLWPLDDAGS